MRIFVLLVVLLCNAFLAFDTKAQDLALFPIERLLNQAKKNCFVNIDSAIYYANEGLIFAKKENKPAQLFEVHRTIGMIYENNSRFEEAKEAYAFALYIAENQLKSEEQLTIYTDWAIVHKKLRQYKIAKEYHLKTVEKASSVGNWEMVEEGYHGLGTMYSMMSDFEQAIFYYHKSIEAARHWGNNKGIALTLQNISNSYFKAKNYAMSRENIVQAHTLALELKDTIRVAAILGVYGNIEAAANNFEIALEKHQRAKLIFEEKGEKSRLAEALLSIGDIYFQQKKLDDAEQNYKYCLTLKDYLSPYAQAKFYNKLGDLYQAKQQIENAIAAFGVSLQKTDSLSFREIARDNHLALSNIFKQKNNFQAAFFHIAEANRLADILFIEDKQKNLTEAQFRFDLEKLDLQIQVQAQDLKRSQQIRYLLLFGLVLVSSLLFFTWRQMKAKQNATIRLELLMKELHHRVKNNLQTMVSLMRLQARKITDETSRDIINESRNRLETISMLHQQFYKNEEIDKVDFQPFLQDLIQKLCYTYNFPEDAIKTNIEVEKNILNVDTSLPIALIINELLHNSFKYAFEKTEHPIVEIHLKNGKLTYNDNGIGIPAIYIKQHNTTFGLQLISSLAKQLKSSYQFFNQNGMRFEMSL